MIHRGIFFSAILLLCLTFSAQADWLGCFKCPTDEDVDYNPRCVKAAIPPWPICLLNDLDGWVDKALDSADRCCGDDLSMCKCPKKDSPKFLHNIDLWCRDIEFCDDKHNSNIKPVDSLATVE
jgi:hypothetical protein